MQFSNLYLVPVFLCLATAASAQEEFTGTLGVNEDSSVTGSFTSSSLTLDPVNITQPLNASGDFQSTVPYGTDVTAYSLTISNLTSSLQALSISDFLEIGTAGEFGSAGTSPPNQFDFNLQSLEETDPVNGNFIGYGTLVDTTGTYADAQVMLDLSFVNPDTYSFTLDTVPEPATYALLLAGIGLLPFLRRKVKV